MAEVDERSPREKLITEHLRIFQLPKEAVKEISSRMAAYVANYLKPDLWHIEFSEFSDLNPEQMNRFRQVISDIHNGVVKCKDAIFWERFALEILLVDPDAFKRMRQGGDQPPIQ
ncbi:MAG: hypothetical protein ACLQBD_25650 [Syntrophobacteraceae bacterium]